MDTKQLDNGVTVSDTKLSFKHMDDGSGRIDPNSYEITFYINSESFTPEIYRAFTSKLAEAIPGARYEESGLSWKDEPLKSVYLIYREENNPGMVNHLIGLLRETGINITANGRPWRDGGLPPDINQDSPRLPTNIQTAEDFEGLINSAFKASMEEHQTSPERVEETPDPARRIEGRTDHPGIAQHRPGGRDS